MAETQPERYLTADYSAIELRILADERQKAIEHLKSLGGDISADDAEKLLMQFHCSFPSLKRWTDQYTSEELRRCIQQIKGGG